MLPKLKNFWLRFKWYIIITLFIILLICLYVFTNEKEDSFKELSKWMLQKKVESDKQKVQVLKDMSGGTEEEIKRVEKEIEEVRKVQKEIDKDVENRDVEELSEAFKRLGY